MAEDDEWKFSVDEVGEDADESGSETAGRDADADDAQDDDPGVTVIGGDDDGPTVRVGGPKTAAEELDGDGDGEGVAGPLAPAAPVEAGTPEAENALFVALGVFLTLFVVLSVAVQLDSVGTLALAGVVAAVSVALYALFRRF